MGGRPLTALAIAAFPQDADEAVLGQIFAGGLEALREAGGALLGGHTVQDPEIKFGYAVTGDVHPARFWANGGGEPGGLFFPSQTPGARGYANRPDVGR